ncbi:hypothetical protein [Roseomonas mucosa]|uniref:hypothetical protein n=1 Tax=Roseomonas mucosa TaxID=207340 RepID=UPI0028CCE930|nr:hypothetical protein [Roseomonas mucosa]MDT8315787.1 hypothetical protein [Roseomonas mucosa]MDT8362152.1 hypothetical protein [Roseomonas mucosa]
MTKITNRIDKQEPCHRERGRPDAPSGHPLSAARGILLAVLLGVVAWIGIYWMVR